RDDLVTGVQTCALPIYLGKAALWGLGGAVVLAAGGWAFAPIVATYLGAAAGLSGAAATAHGLALLGGGTLAAGGFGMAGGMWIRSEERRVGKERRVRWW